MSARHCASTSVLLRNCCLSCCAKQSHKDNVRSSAVEKQLKQRKSNLLGPAPPPCSWYLLGSLDGPASPPSSLNSTGPANGSPTSSWGSSTTSLLLISPGPAKVSHLFEWVQARSRGGTGAGLESWTSFATTFAFVNVVVLMLLFCTRDRSSFGGYVFLVLYRLFFSLANFPPPPPKPNVNLMNTSSDDL